MKQSPYTTVLFDWDGCLANTIDVWVDCVDVCLREHNIIASREDIISNVIVKYDNVVKLGITDPRTFGVYLNEMILTNAPKMMLNPSAKEILHELQKANKHVGVVTSSGRKGLEIAMDALGIKDYFDVIIAHEDVSHLKPHPEGILKALKAVNASPVNAIMFGDTRNDILGGKNAGMATGLYFPPNHETLYDKDYLLALNADYYIRHLDQVLEIVI